MKKVAIIIIVAIIGILVGGVSVYLIYAYNPNKELKSDNTSISFGAYQTYETVDENNKDMCSIKYDDKDVVSVEQIVLKESGTAKYIVKTCYGEYAKEYNWRYIKAENEKALYLVETSGSNENVMFELIQSNAGSTLYVRNNKNDNVKLLQKATEEMKIDSSSNQFEKKLPKKYDLISSIDNYKKINLIMNLFEENQKFISDENIYLQKANQGGMEVFIGNKRVASAEGNNLSVYTINDKVLLVGDLLFGLDENLNLPSLIEADNILVFDLKGSLKYSLNKDLYSKKIYTKTNSNFKTIVSVNEKNIISIEIKKYFNNCSNFYGQCDADENELYNYKLDLSNLKLIKQ